MKYCPNCNLQKDISEFHRSARSKDGAQAKCKLCYLAYKKARRRTNDLERKYDRARYASKKESILIAANFLVKRILKMKRTKENILHAEIIINAVKQLTK